MRTLLGVGAVLALSGCAGMGGLQAEPPYYDRNQHALIGDGYPVERIDMPAGFEFADIYSAKRRQEHDSPQDQGSARVTEVGVSWVSVEGGAAQATAMHQGASPGSQWLPWENSDGYEFVGDHRVQYGLYKGEFREVAGDPSSMPALAPECAVSSHLGLHSTNRRYRAILTYTEGMPCGDLAAFGQSDADAQRQRAYRAFGLR